MGVIIYPLSVVRCPSTVVRRSLSVVRCPGRCPSLVGVRALPFDGCPSFVVQGVALFRLGDVQGVSLCWLASPFRGGWRGLLFLLFFNLAFFYEFSGVSKFCKAGCKFFNCCFFRVVSDGDGACVDVCLE